MSFVLLVKINQKVKQDYREGEREIEREQTCRQWQLEGVRKAG